MRLITTTSFSHKMFQRDEFILNNGICLPASCKQQKIVEILKEILPMNSKVLKIECKTKDPLPFDRVDIAAM